MRRSKIVGTFATTHRILCMPSESAAFVAPSPRRGATSFVGAHPSSRSLHFCSRRCGIDPNDPLGGARGRDAFEGGEKDVVDVADEHANGNYNDDTAVGRYLRDELSMPSADIDELKRYRPWLFDLSLNDDVEPVVFYLYSLMGHDDLWAASPTSEQTRRVAEMVAGHPTLLLLDAAADLEPTAEFLRDCCELTEEELSKVIAATPGVLGLSVEDNLKPTMEFLADNMRMWSQSKDGQ